VQHARTANYGKKSRSKHDIDPHRRGCDKLPTSVRTRFESTCESPAVEKTLYVDSVHEVSSEMKFRTDHREDDFETLRKDSSIDKITSIESSIVDSKHIVVLDAKSALQPKGSVFLDSTLLVCYDNSSDDMQMKKTNNHSNKINTEKQGSNIDRDFSTLSRLEMVEDKKIESKNEVPSNKISSNGQIQNPAPWRNLQLSSDSEFGLKIQCAAKLVNQERTHVRDSNENPSNLTSLKVVGARKNDSENQLPMKLGHTKTSNASSLKVPLALPSPKAPSESWLKRTLPTVSSKNISRSNFAVGIHAPAQTPNAALLDYHGHLRFAEVIQLILFIVSCNCYPSCGRRCLYSFIFSFFQELAPIPEA
jgi:hypothetical protein